MRGERCSMRTLRASGRFAVGEWNSSLSVVRWLEACVSDKDREARVVAEIAQANGYADSSLQGQAVLELALVLIPCLVQMDTRSGAYRHGLQLLTGLFDPDDELQIAHCPDYSGQPYEYLAGIESGGRLTGFVTGPRLFALLGPDLIAALHTLAGTPRRLSALRPKPIRFLDPQAWSAAATA